ILQIKQQGNYMNLIIAKGLLIPFLGTALGSALVFFMKKELDVKIQKMRVIIRFHFFSTLINF
ncbi:MAG: hypothetical protein MSA96_02730, partial [Treponema porcinum]|nr:hypothetical protein [Treponema porcinum]